MCCRKMCSSGAQLQQQLQLFFDVSQLKIPDYRGHRKGTWWPKRGSSPKTWLPTGEIGPADVTLRHVQAGGNGNFRSALSSFLLFHPERPRQQLTRAESSLVDRSCALCGLQLSPAAREAANRDPVPSSPHTNTIPLFLYTFFGCPLSGCNQPVQRCREHGMGSTPANQPNRL
ncbi:hypothetical protein VTI74DRAFT_11660 [Chaetomium olivicolor]